MFRVIQNLSIQYIDSFKNILYKTIYNKLFLFYVILLIIILSTGSFFIYKNYITPNIGTQVLNKEYISKIATNNNNNNNNNNNTNNNNNKNDVTCIYFYTRWCPFCKLVTKEWIKFKNHIDKNSNYENLNIITSSIDCDINEEYANKYNINEYPTIIILYNKYIYYYDFTNLDKNNEYTKERSEITYQENNLIKYKNLINFLDTVIKENDEREEGDHIKKFTSMFKLS